jgi:hypothetical protein
MATQNLTTADAILKDLYVGPIVEQLNYKTYLLDQIERDADHIDHTGRRAIVPVHSGRNRGRGSRGDAGSLPAAGTQTWADAIINIRRHYTGIEVSDAAVEASQSNQGAFVNVLDAESKGAANDLRKDINRQVFGTGDGLLGSVAATATTTNLITLDSVQYVAVGDPVDVLRRTDGDSSLTNAVNNPVTARVGGTTKTVTLTSAVGGTITTGHGIYLTGSYNNEMDGLRNIISTSRTLHSINSATAGNQYWDGQVRLVGTQAGSEQVAGETVFEQLADDVGLTGQGEISVFLTSRGIRRRLADTYQTQKRFNDAQAVRVHGGYSAIMVNEVPVVADDDCPRHWAFGIDKSALRWFQQAGPGWMEKGGGGIFHLKDGSSAGTKVATWQAWFKWYAALGCVAPNRLGALKFATDDNPA